MSIEIKLKPKHLHPTAKRQKSTSSTAGTTGGKKHKVTNGLGAIARAEAVKLAQMQTAQNKKILFITADGKRRFMLMSEYETR
jgi:lysophospholipid acyltransferase (LPLAT)-like uncharacterized protein